MLHWLRKARNRLSRRQHFWTKLLFVSFVAHSIVLFAVLFLYKGDYFSYDVMVSTKLLRSGVPVIFMPFHKTINESVVATVETVKSSTKATTFKMPDLQVKKLVLKELNKKINEKKERSKVAQKKKPVLQKKKKEQKVVQKKGLKKQIVAKAQKKKIAKKKVESQKKQKPIVAQNQSKQETPIYVGQVEMEALHMQEQLQREMSQHWKPPIGLNKDLKCVLKVLVDWSGVVRETVVYKSSGVLMYDISTRTAVAYMQMPAWARGKEFNITFKQ